MITSTGSAGAARCTAPARAEHMSCARDRGGSRDRMGACMGPVWLSPVSAVRIGSGRGRKRSLRATVTSQMVPGGPDSRQTEHERQRAKHILALNSSLQMFACMQTKTAESNQKTATPVSSVVCAVTPVRIVGGISQSCTNYHLPRLACSHPPELVHARTVLAPCILHALRHAAACCIVYAPTRPTPHLTHRLDNFTQTFFLWGAHLPTGLGHCRRLSCTARLASRVLARANAVPRRGPARDAGARRRIPRTALKTASSPARRQCRRARRPRGSDRRRGAPGTWWPRCRRPAASAAPPAR